MNDTNKPKVEDTSAQNEVLNQQPQTPQTMVSQKTIKIDENSKIEATGELLDNPQKIKPLQIIKIVIPVVVIIIIILLTLNYCTQPS